LFYQWLFKCFHGVFIQEWHILNKGVVVLRDPSRDFQ
jgi:hypothetical protein